MASISSPGLGSGLDVSGIITKLMQAESLPLTALARKEASYQAKLSAFGSMQGALSSLQTAAQTLKSTSTFTGKSASVADSTVLSASAVLTADAGTYDVSITTLAKNHIVRSNVNYELTDTFSGGSLDIRIGSDNGTGGSLTTVTIPDGSTLVEVKDAINDAGAGLKASIVNDGTTNRLVLSSDNTGSDGNIWITANQTGSGGTKDLTDFVYNGADATVSQVRPADDAVFSVNGLSVSRSSNTVTDVINGVTFNLAKEGGSTKLTVAANSDAAVTAVTAFVKAYNDSIGQLKTLTAFDAASNKGAVLTGDGTARSIQAQLAALMGANVTNVPGGISRLSDLGVAMQKDGTLALDSSKFKAALADPDTDVSAFFTQTTTNNQGIAVRFNTLLTSLVGTNSLISARTEGINTSIKSLQKQTEALNLRLEQIEKRYRAQFTSLDTLVSSMQKTSSYLTQQLASMPSSK
jgi:flagellar hook-associated protein 2